VLKVLGLEIPNGESEVFLEMSKAKILIVEDELDIRELIALHLGREGYPVDQCESGADGLKKIQENHYQLIVLDWMLPDMSGLDILKRVKSNEGTKALPVIMVTARGEATDIVEGLESGADDYLAKPFDTDVLLARVSALLRRVSLGVGDTQKKPSEVLKLGNLEINTALHEARCSGELLDLTPSEFKLALTLVSNRGRVLTRKALIEEIQGKGISVVDRAIDTHVFGLRKKLGPCSELIETVRGVGYRVSP